VTANFVVAVFAAGVDTPRIALSELFAPLGAPIGAILPIPLLISFPAAATVGPSAADVRIDISGGSPPNSFTLDATGRALVVASAAA
jgi:hypothetical protein